MMILNDRATYREADSHTIFFGCVECLEEALERLRLETYSRILNTQSHPVTFFHFSSKQ